MTDDLIASQRAYYRERAGEYDEWWLRQGRYDRGPEFRARWEAEVAVLEAALDAFGPSGDVLELAAGTGLWTQRLARHADRLTAVDASAETMAINRARVADPRVEYVQADLFDWRPPRRFDAVFFGFWLTHVPPARFDDFWRLVEESLAPGGRFFYVDSHYSQEGTARDQTVDRSGRQVRRLNDGRIFDIVKVYYHPDDLRDRLAALGWDAATAATDEFFIYGSGRRAVPDGDPSADQ